jgi:NitT/TauT family transport system substrate-binding protein
MKLRIGHLSTFYHTSILMIAMDTMGAEAEWKLFGTGPAIVNAFEKGEVDLAYIGLPPAIIGIDRGVNIKCIAGGHVEGTVISGRNQFKGYYETSSLDEILKQFAGHKIGVPGKGSIHDVIISECLKSRKLDKEIEIVNFKWADQVLEAMHKGEISAAAGTPALAVAVKNYADCKVLYPPSKLWPDNPSYGILVKNNILVKGSETVERFLIFHEEATSFLRNKSSEAANIISDYVGVVDKNFVLDTLKISPKYCACLTDEYISSTMEFVRVLKKLGYINREISFDEIFDTALIRKIHTSKDHYQDGIAAKTPHSQ